MEKVRKTAIVTDFCDIACEMHYIAAGLIAEDDMEGIEKTLMEIVDCQAEFIIFIMYLFQNCRLHQAKNISYYAREFTTHSYSCTTQALFIEEIRMWKEFGIEDCVIDVFNRLKRAKKAGLIASDFDVTRYLPN